MADLLLYLTDFRENAVSNCIDIPLSPVEKRISDIVSFINNNYAANITLDFLCSKFFINKYYLCHIFKKIIGISIVDFINQKRIAEAEKLIRLTTHSITDISCMAGFNNTNYFINLFKKKNGVTPKVYRETSVISIL